MRWVEPDGAPDPLEALNPQLPRGKLDEIWEKILAILKPVEQDLLKLWRDGKTFEQAMEELKMPKPAGIIVIRGISMKLMEAKIDGVEVVTGPHPALQWLNHDSSDVLQQYGFDGPGDHVGVIEEMDPAKTLETYFQLVSTAAMSLVLQPSTAFVVISNRFQDGEPTEGFNIRIGVAAGFRGGAYQLDLVEEALNTALGKVRELKDKADEVIGSNEPIWGSSSGSSSRPDAKRSKIDYSPHGVSSSAILCRTRLPWSLTKIGSPRFKSGRFMLSAVSSTLRELPSCTSARSEVSSPTRTGIARMKIAG